MAVFDKRCHRNRISSKNAGSRKTQKDYKPTPQNGHKDAPFNTVLFESLAKVLYAGRPRQVPPIHGLMRDGWMLPRSPNHHAFSAVKPIPALWLRPASTPTARWC